MDCILFLNRFKLFYNQSFQPLSEKYALQMLDIDLLLFVCNHPKLNTARDAVALRGLSKSNVSISLAKLRTRGLVRLQTQPDNRRLQRIFLTPEGERIARELRVCQQACFAQLFAGFTEDEQAQLRQYLSRLQENITAAVKPEHRKEP